MAHNTVKAPMKTAANALGRLLTWSILAVVAAQFIAGQHLTFDRYYRAGELSVDPNPASKGDIRLKYDGGPLRRFLGSYSVVIRTFGTNQIACETKSARFTYRPGSVRPDPLTLAWWAPGDDRCAGVGPGVYEMETCWTIHDRLDGFLPPVTRCIQTIPFQVGSVE